LVGLVSTAFSNSQFGDTIVKKLESLVNKMIAG